MEGVINYDMVDWGSPLNSTPEPSFIIKKKLEWIPYSTSGDRLWKSEYRDSLLEELSGGTGALLKFNKSVYTIVKKERNILGIKYPREELHILECTHNGKYLEVIEKFEYNNKVYSSKRNIKKIDLEQSEDFIIEKYKEKYL